MCGMRTKRRPSIYEHCYLSPSMIARHLVIHREKNKGFQARTYILDDTCSTYVRYNKKVVYLSHRRFLSPKYPLREEGIKHFEGVGVKRKKPCTMVIR
jgi:hypothetical protein